MLRGFVVSADGMQPLMLTISYSQYIIKNDLKPSLSVGSRTDISVIGKDSTSRLTELARYQYKSIVFCCK